MEVRKEGSLILLKGQKMAKINDLNLENWKDISLNTDSLRIISERKKWGKHSNFYHWNFVPQIPNEFIQRYTKQDDRIFDPFLWSATSAIECEELKRNIVWIDIQKNLIDRAQDLIGQIIKRHFICGDSSSDFIKERIQKILIQEWVAWFQLSFLHPPYADIIKFSDDPKDLSNYKNLEDFYAQFWAVVRNTFDLTKKWWYLVVVIGDKYQGGEWIPLGFWCMQRVLETWFKLKSIVVKNMEWNRAKLGSWGIWRYRALNSDYFIFKHEYILIFKK